MMIDRIPGMEHAAGQRKKKLWVVAVLSLVPGLSLLYLGKTRKTLPIFLVDIAILAGFFLTGSYLIRFLLVNVYIVTFLAPFVESYQLARYGKNRIDAGSRWYVSFLLLTTGFNALPLLWQSGNFTREAKILWTITVPLLFVFFVFILARYGQQGEALLRNIADMIRRVG